MGWVLNYHGLILLMIVLKVHVGDGIVLKPESYPPVAGYRDAIFTFPVTLLTNSMGQELEGKRSMAPNQLKIAPIERVKIGTDTASGQCY